MRSETTFAGSGNEGLQMGQNLGTVNVNFHRGRLSFLFHKISFHLY
jgi:SesB domain on fungal death-pathway protein